MVKAQLSLFWLMALSFFLSFPDSCIAKLPIPKDCGSSYCGNVTVNFPFRLKSQLPECGYHNLELECDNNNRTTFVFVGEKLYVQKISYENQTIRAMDMMVHERLSTDNCSLPRDITRYVSYYWSLNSTAELYVGLNYPSSVMYLVNCTTAMKSSLYVNASRCSNSYSHPPSYFYFLDENTRPSDFNPSCLVIADVPIMLGNITGRSTSDIYEQLLQGYELEWEFHNFYTCCEDSLIRQMYIYFVSCNNRRNCLTKNVAWDIYLDCGCYIQITKKTLIRR